MLKIVPYKPSYLDRCIEIFRSNLEPYFSPEEENEYVRYLGTITEDNRYFVVLDNTQIVAAGGFAVQDETVRFTWGMVDRDQHARGYGSFLLEQRLNRIKELFPGLNISLDTSQHTLDFYKRQGFYPIRKEINGYGDRLHKIEMRFNPEQQQVQFDTAIELHGHGLQLNPYKTTDFEYLYKVASDPLIWEQHPASDRYQRPIFRDYFSSGLMSGMAYIIKDNDTGEVIGSSRYHQPDIKTKSVEIGWTFLAREYWGGEINARLKDVMLQHAFDYFDKVHFCIGTDNQRSIQAVRKLGAVAEATVLDTGRPDSVWYGLTMASYTGLANYGQR
jgi:RimJ/RimL family protein N-acetyltransferase